MSRKITLKGNRLYIPAGGLHKRIEECDDLELIRDSDWEVRSVVKYFDKYYIATQNVSVDENFKSRPAGLIDQSTDYYSYVECEVTYEAVYTIKRGNKVET